MLEIVQYLTMKSTMYSFYVKYLLERWYPFSTAFTDLLKMVPVKILLNLGNYFRTLQLGF